MNTLPETATAVWQASRIALHAARVGVHDLQAIGFLQRAAVEKPESLARVARSTLNAISSGVSLPCDCEPMEAS